MPQPKLITGGLKSPARFIARVRNEGTVTIYDRETKEEVVSPLPLIVFFIDKVFYLQKFKMDTKERWASSIYKSKKDTIKVYKDGLDDPIYTGIPKTIRDSKEMLTKMTIYGMLESQDIVEVHFTGTGIGSWIPFETECEFNPDFAITGFRPATPEEKSKRFADLIPEISFVDCDESEVFVKEVFSDKRVEVTEYIQKKLSKKDAGGMTE